MQIKISRQAIKILDKMDQKTAIRILDALSGLEEIPPKGDIKPLKGFTQKYRLRIGAYRILFSISENEIYITDIGPRGDIYK